PHRQRKESSSEIDSSGDGSSHDQQEHLRSWRAICESNSRMELRVINCYSYLARALAGDFTGKAGAQTACKDLIKRGACFMEADSGSTTASISSPGTKTDRASERTGDFSSGRS